MKKILLLATLVLSFVMGHSQTTYPVIQNLGAPKTLVIAKGGLKADSSLILPVFPDTASANISTFINKYPGTLIRVGDTIYVRSADTTIWLSLSAGNINQIINNFFTYQTRFISGSAVWDSLMIYSVTRCFYYINGTLYNSAATNVTLNPSDSSNPRIDVIYCDTSGLVGVITGIPSPDPVKPTVNPLSQIELTHVYINAQGTTPANVSKQIVYNENLQVPNEWNTSSTGLVVDFAYTTNPYVGIKSILAPLYELPYSLIFTNTTNADAAILSDLSMYIILNSASPAKTDGVLFNVLLFKAGVQVSSIVQVIGGLYGYDPSIISSYQHLAIPFTTFVFRNSLDKTFDEIRFQMIPSSIPKLGMQFDYITTGAGGTPPPIISNYWSLSGNDNSSIPAAKLGTTSKNVLSIVTNDVERINIAEDGLITIPNINTTSDTTEYKPLSIGSTGEVSKMTSWGNNTVYTINPIMSTVSNDSNIIYFNADTAAAWRSGDKWSLFGNSNAIAGTNFLGTTNNIPLEFRIKNVKSGIIDSTNKNVGLGFNTLKLNTPNGTSIGTYNVAIGHNALSKDTFGIQNVAIGGGVMGTLTTLARGNVGIGYAALNQSKTPSYDVAVGWGSLARDYFGSYNTAIGSNISNMIPPVAGDTMKYNTFIGASSAAYQKSGRNNVFVGDSTGALNQNGSRNILIGSKAGLNETGSDKLYIANSSTSNPLILGDFADSTLKVNGKLSISIASQLPDSSLDVTGGVHLRSLYSSNNAADSMMVIKSDGGIGYRSIPSGGGGTQDIDQVLTVGNVATNKQLFFEETDATRHLLIENRTSGGGINKIGLSITDDITTATGGINENNIYIGLVDTTTSLEHNKIKFSNSLYVQTINPSLTYSNQKDTLPTQSGVFAMSVNNNKADASGNITLSTSSGTVTSISQGYGITNSPNPIVATGTVIVDTTTGGLSGKYVRITDTATMLLPYLFGSGTANYVPKFNASRNLGNSLIYDNGTSVGVSTSTPNASWKLDVNGIINTNNGVNIATNGAKTGFFGNANTFDIWAGNNKIATWGLATVGGTLYDHFMNWVYTTGFTGASSAFRIASSITSTGTNNASLSQLLINPTYSQQTFGTGTLRGIYYNPIIGTLNGSTHIAFESTSGNTIMHGIKTSSSTTDSIAIWINDTLSKAPYPAGGSGTVYVDSIYRTAGKDSFFYKKNGNTYAIKDSVGTNPAPLGYFGAWQDLVTQTAAADNVGYTMIFRTQDVVPNGISIVNNGSSLPTRITFANGGIYNIQFSSEFQSNSTAIETITIWLRKNGVDVVGSAGVLTTAIKKAGNVYTAIASWNYLLDIVGGEYYELVWSTTNHTDVTMQYYAAGSPPPAAASVILSVTQQSGIMAGTGITAINSLTGAVQTMVVGTDSSDFKIASTGTSHTFNLPTASASKRGALSSADWSIFNGKIGAADTSVFQRKNIAAYSIMANNTASAANVAPLVYKDLGEQVYAGTITWTFTGSAPAGTTTLYYRWSQVGKTVNYNFYFYYATASSLASAITFDLPTDMPTPQQPTGSLGTNSFLYKSNNVIALNQTGVPVYSSGGLRKSATGYEWNVTTTSGTWRWVEVTGTYFVN